MAAQNAQAGAGCSQAVVETMLGTVRLTATNLGLCRLEIVLPGEGVQRAAEMEDVAGEAARSHLPQAIDQLQAYLAGERRPFYLALDLSRGSQFQQSVWRAIVEIPYGQVRSYADVAGMIGQLRATRAVGGALHRNPLPIIVPCHRVVAADGSLGGFGLGSRLKRALLRVEGHPLGMAYDMSLPGLEP